MSAPIALYTVLGWFDVGFVAAIAWVRPIFWLEVVGLVAFGFSWLVKGETLWRDRSPI